MNKDVKEIFKVLDDKASIEKFGVPRDVFIKVASEYALAQIKEIKNPTDAAKKFVEIVKEFISAVN